MTSPELPTALTTARLRLRRPRPEDADAMLDRWLGDAEATRFMLFAPYAKDDRAGVDAFLAMMLRNWDEGRGHRLWLIERDADPRPIGALGVTPDAATATNHAFLIGYILARDVWGHGYTTEALAGMTERLFERPATWRVWAPTHVANAASQRVLAKAGFTREATLRRHLVFPAFGPEPQDCSLWSRSRDDLARSSP